MGQGFSLSISSKFLYLTGERYMSKRHRKATASFICVLIRSLHSPTFVFSSYLSKFFWITIKHESCHSFLASPSRTQMRRSVTLILSQRTSRDFHPRKDHSGRHTEVMKLLSVSSIQNAKEEAIFFLITECYILIFGRR